MRTLLVAPALHSAPGGIPRILRLYQRALADLAGPDDAIDVLVLNDPPADAARAAGPRIDRTAGCTRRKTAFLAQLLRLGWRADRILCGHIHLAPAVRLLQRLRPGLEVWIVGHGIEIWRRLGGPERQAVLAARGMLCVSRFSRSELLRHNPEIPADRVAVVSNGLDPGFAAGATAPGPALPLPGREAAIGHVRPAPVLLSVARLDSADRNKGVEMVIAALPLIRAEFPGATLRIVGTGDDRPRLEALANAVERVAAPARCLERGPVSDAPATTSPPDPLAGARSHPRAHLGDPSAAALPILFLGAIDDAALRAEYAACDVLVLPSRKEGFGLVYLEAMAFGKPCVAALAGGAPEVLGVDESALAGAASEVLGAGEPAIAGTARPAAAGSFVRAAGGALVPFGEPAALAAAVSELIRQPPDPGRVRAQAATFSYEAFRTRLAEIVARRPA